METILCAGGIVLNRDRDVLVVTNKHGYHTYPKGTRKRETPDSPPEDPLATAWREIYEESGLTEANLVLIGPLGHIVRPGHTAENGLVPSVTKRIDMFHFLSNTVELRPVESDIVEARWVRPIDLPRTLTWSQEDAFFMNRLVELGYSEAD